jgi:transposase
MGPSTIPAWGAELTARTQELRQLVKTDGDPRVRQRAQALLLVGEGQSMAEVARLLHMAAHRLRVWRGRFLVEGRAGLVDRRRGGCPHALDAAARAFLEQALEQGPQAYGLPMTIWSIRDLDALLLRERACRSVSTPCIGWFRLWGSAIAARGTT